MPYPADAQCLSGLHRLMHERATADLPGAVGLAPTLAYTDLIFSFAFARIGAEADSLACERAAAEVLEPRTELAHQWLLSLFRYRVGAARRGEPHGGIVPPSVGIPTVTELRAERGGEWSFELNLPVYTSQSCARALLVLDPEGATSPFSEWTKKTDPIEHALSRLTDERDAARVATDAVAMLHQLESRPAVERLRLWTRLYPLVRRAGRALAIEMTLAVPNVARVPYARKSNWEVLTDHALRDALDFVSHLDDTEAFPPLLDALADRARAAPGAIDRYGALAALTWPCLRWFRSLGRSEAATLLDRTRDLWPKDVRTETAAPQNSEHTYPTLEAHLVGAALREYAGEDGATARAITDVSEAIAARGTRRLQSAHSAIVTCAVATASGAISTELARTTIPDFVRAIPRITSMFATHDYYSRSHLQLAEAVALAAVGDW